MLYFMVYLSMATFYPLLGRYYQMLNFSGTEIGILFGAGTFTTMLIQPLWGIICDKRGKCKEVCAVMQISIIFIALVLPAVKSYYSLLIVMVIHFVFQCGLFPILDTMVFKDVYDFGKIRLWGSLGFAVMVLFSGKISEIIGINNMFYLYSFSTAMSLLILLQLKEVEVKTEHKEKKSTLKTLRELAKPEFILFVLVSFFLIGTFMGASPFYSILFTEKMGNMTMFGISYFFIAASEIPFLRWSKKIVRRMGSEKALILAGIILLFRFSLYGIASTYVSLLIFSVVAGSYVGFLLPAVAEYLKEHIKAENRSTAIGIYSSAGNGLGAMLFQLSGGVIYDYTNISMVYAFLCCFVIFGIISAFLLMKLNRKIIPYASVSSK